MGRFSAGNPADPARLERILNAKQRLIGVSCSLQGGCAASFTPLYVLLSQPVAACCYSGQCSTVLQETQL